MYTTSLATKSEEARSGKGECVSCDCQAPISDPALLVAWLQGSGAYEQSRRGPIMLGTRWSLILSTEELRFQESPDPTRTLAPDIELKEALVVRGPQRQRLFAEPGLQDLPRPAAHNVHLHAW
jgi:hypothetical protein